MNTLITRFAPSPTGYMHRGHVLNAIYCWGIVHSNGGKVLLRIEDHDQGRSRPEHIQSIYDDLDWLGFIPDAESPLQSQCMQQYQTHLHSLIEKKLAYKCTCTRKEIQQYQKAEAEELCYDGTCRSANHPADIPGTWRLLLPEERIQFSDVLCGPQEQHPLSQCGDIALLDRNGHFTYQYAVVLDDLRDNINCIIRGTDILSSTGRQLLMRKLFGDSRAPEFYHHPLILDQEGRKLSKRQRSFSLTEEREAGAKPEMILGELCFQAGLIKESKSIQAKDVPELFANQIFSSKN